jgi:hypothetical protein
MTTTRTKIKEKPAAGKKSKSAAGHRGTTRTKGKTSGRRWSAEVTEHSNALDLDKGVFKLGSPGKIAKSLERSAARSTRKKSGGYQSAMSMLNFYINRAGKNLSASKKKILEKAKDILRADHGKENKRQ